MGSAFGECSLLRILFPVATPIWASTVIPSLIQSSLCRWENLISQWRYHEWPAFQYFESIRTLSPVLLDKDKMIQGFLFLHVMGCNFASFRLYDFSQVWIIVYMHREKKWISLNWDLCVRVVAGTFSSFHFLGQREALILFVRLLHGKRRLDLFWVHSSVVLRLLRFFTDCCFVSCDSIVRFCRRFWTWIW